jgi:hypothetical protein
MWVTEKKGLKMPSKYRPYVKKGGRREEAEKGKKGTKGS